MKAGRARGQLRGQALVELALILPIMVLLIGGGIDLARSYFMGIEVSDGASQAALYVSENSALTSTTTSPPTLFTDTQLARVVTASYGGSVLSCPTVSVTQSQTPSSAATAVSTGSPAEDSFYEDVTVTCQFFPLTPFLPLHLAVRSTSGSYVLES